LQLGTKVLAGALDGALRALVAAAVIILSLVGVIAWLLLFAR